MDIKQTRPSLSQEANSALDQKSGFSDSPSFMAQFVIRTMGNDLKTIAAPLPPTPSVISPAPATTKTPESIKTSSLPPKETNGEKAAPIAVSPSPKATDEQSKEKKEAQKKLEQEQKAAEKATALAAKQAARAAKEKIAKDKQAREFELRRLLEQAKLNLAAKEFNAAIADAQKIADNTESGWFFKWRAKGLINKIQKEIRQSDAEAQKKLEQEQKAAEKAEEKRIAAEKARILAEEKERQQEEYRRQKELKKREEESKRQEKIKQQQEEIRRQEEMKRLEELRRQEAQKATAAFTAPSNLPTVQEPETATPKPQAAPTPPTPQPPISTPAPMPPAPKPLAPFQMPAGIGPELFEAETEPKETINIKKVLLVGLSSILVLALIIGGLWFFLKQPQGQPAQISQSPTPKPSVAAPAPIVAPAPLFKTDSQKIFELKTGQEKTNIQEAIMQMAQTDEPAENFIYLLFKDSQGKYPSLDKLASSTGIDLFDLPTQVNAGSLKDQLDMNSFSFFAYSQSRPDSSPFVAGTNSGRVGIVIEVKNATSNGDLEKSLKDLEQLMLSGLRILLPDAKDRFPTKPVFLDNTYNNVAVRYINLPEPSLCLDYAILNNKLIFATSKQSMHAIIDRILSQTNPLGQ